jgi:hypothetical protein
MGDRQMESAAKALQESALAAVRHQQEMAQAAMSRADSAMAIAEASVQRARVAEEKAVDLRVTVDAIGGDLKSLSSRMSVLSSKLEEDLGTLGQRVSRFADESLAAGEAVEMLLSTAVDKVIVLLRGDIAVIREEVVSLEGRLTQLGGWIDRTTEKLAGEFPTRIGKVEETLQSLQSTGRDTDKRLTSTALSQERLFEELSRLKVSAISRLWSTVFRWLGMGRHS